MINGHLKYIYNMVKKIVLLFIIINSGLMAAAQAKKNNIHSPDKDKKILIVDASCGECKLGLAGTTCDLTVRINGKAYFVDGTEIDSHGDAHGEEGFCNAIRKAKVQGEIKNNRFKATYFELIPAEDKKKTQD